MNAPLCILVTGSLQPYAIDFYRALDNSLQTRGWRFLVLVGSKGSYRPWADMGIKEDEPLFVFVSGKPAPEWTQRLLGSNFRDKIILPTGSGIGEILSTMGPDLLITNERNPLCISAALWAKRRGVSCLLSTDIGKSPPPHAATKLHLVYHRLIAGLFDGVIAKTKDGETAFAKRNAPKPVLAPHGINASNFPLSAGPKSEPFCFLFVGVLQELKGLDTLMAAGRQLHSQGIRFVIRLVGNGPWTPTNEDAAATWLSLAGFKEGSALLDEYHAAGAFVLPTRGDTYGVVVHEAAASGLPLLVSTAAGACHTLVQDGVSGFRFDPLDSLALANRMAMMLNDESLRTALGIGARKLALEWCTTRSAERVAQWLLQFRPHVQDTDD